MLSVNAAMGQVIGITENHGKWYGMVDGLQGCNGTTTMPSKCIYYMEEAEGDCGSD